MKNFWIALIAVTTAILVIGCAGGKPYDPGTGTTGTGFSIGPVSGLTVTAGDTVTFPITVFKTLLEEQGAAAADGDVTLSVTGVPNDFTSSFTVNPVTPTVDGTPTGLVIDTAPSGGEGAGKHTRSQGPSDITYDLTITGTDGKDTHSVTTTLTVTFGTPDFTITAPASRTVQQFGTAHYPITVTQTGNGTPLPVTLSVTDIDEFFGFSFTHNPVTPTTTGAHSQLDIDTDSSPSKFKKGNGVSSETFPFTIVGTDGVHTHSVDTQLVVQLQGD